MLHIWLELIWLSRCVISYLNVSPVIVPSSPTAWWWPSSSWCCSSSWLWPSCGGSGRSAAKWWVFACRETTIQASFDGHPEENASKPEWFSGIFQDHWDLQPLSALSTLKKRQSLWRRTMPDDSKCCRQCLILVRICWDRRHAEIFSRWRSQTPCCSEVRLSRRIWRENHPPSVWARWGFWEALRFAAIAAARSQCGHFLQKQEVVRLHPAVDSESWVCVQYQLSSEVKKILFDIDVLFLKVTLSGRLRQSY